MLETPKFTLAQCAKTIDHAVLKPEMTKEEVISGCALAREYNVASICCKPCDVKLCKKELDGSDVLIGTVVGFPHGSQAASVKAFETEQAVKDGATEIDVVINIGWLRSGDLQAVEDEVALVVKAAAGNCVKVIFENAYLNNQQIEECCALCERAGAHYVKTSTGFASSGAKLEDVHLMVQCCDGRLKVKSAGGVRKLDQLLAFMEAGVTRSGASSTKAMLDEYKERWGSGTE
jgi:deoxyribose-phosphate aldolase